MHKNYLSLFQSSASPRRTRYGWVFGLLVILGFSSTKLLKGSLPYAATPSSELAKNPFPGTADLKEYLQRLNPAQKKEVDLIARTVFGEARGEKSFDSLQAIAHVILNRVKDNKNWPNSVRAVIHQKNQFSCWNEGDPNYGAVQSVTFNNPEFRQAYQATLAALLSEEDITHGANHYHAKWVNPSWAQQKNMIPVAEIEQHLFYKA